MAKTQNASQTPVAAGNDIATALQGAIVDQMLTEQAESIAPVALPFTITGWKLNGKAQDFPSTDDPSVVSRKVALATVAIAGTALTFTAAIYRVTHGKIKNDKGQTKVVTRMTLPSTGKGFPVPVFNTDDPRTERALAEFRAAGVASYKAWIAGIDGGKSAVGAAQTAHASDAVDFE